MMPPETSQKQENVNEEATVVVPSDSHFPYATDVLKAAQAKLRPRSFTV
jgi:hypothetical protein